MVPSFTPESSLSKGRYRSAMIQRLLLPLLPLLVAASACSAPPQEGNLRVATYNIEWFGEDSNPQRIENLKSVIANVKPNVVGLQEIQSRRALSQVFDDQWELGIKDEGTEDQEPAIAVRKPLRLDECDTIFKDSLFDYAFPGKRDGLRAVVSDPSGKKVTFYILHMKSRSGGRIKTDAQREFAMGMLAAYIRGKNEPNVVVLGDMNDTPDDRSVNILESGNLMASAGEAKVENPLLVNVTEPLYRSDGVSIGLHELFQGQEVAPMVKDARSENERTRGIEYKYPDDLKVTQVLFDQILISPSLAKEASKAQIYSGIDALRGTPSRTTRDAAGAKYTEKGSRTSDHLPVFVDVVLK